MDYERAVGAAGAGRRHHPEQRGRARSLGERDDSGAIDLWRQAISVLRGSAVPHLRLAEALAAAQRPDEAVAEYLTAISLKAGADAHRRLAEVWPKTASKARRQNLLHLS